MRKKISGLQGITILDKSDQKKIQGGDPDFLTCYPATCWDLDTGVIRPCEICCSKAELGGGGCFAVD